MKTSMLQALFGGLLIIFSLMQPPTQNDPCYALRVQNDQLKHDLYGPPGIRVEPLDGKCPVEGFNLHPEVVEKQDVSWETDYYDEGGDSTQVPVITNKHFEFHVFCERR